MQQNQTSRGVVVDLVEMIKEELAIYSHLQELYKEAVDNIDKANEDGADDEILGSLIKEAGELKDKIKNAYSRRQKAMNELKGLAINYNHKAWCLVKHSIKEWGIAEEVWNTDMNNLVYEEIMLDAESFCYKCLSLFLGTEIVTCGRCLTDELLSSNNEGNG